MTVYLCTWLCMFSMLSVISLMSFGGLVLLIVNGMMLLTSLKMEKRKILGVTLKNFIFPSHRRVSAGAICVFLPYFLRVIVISFHLSLIHFLIQKLSMSHFPTSFLSLPRLRLVVASATTEHEIFGPIPR